MNLKYFYGNATAVHFLLDAGANANIKDSEGNTPLHYASHRGYLATVETLVENNSNISQKNNDGITPLELADTCGHKGIVNFLTNKLTPKNSTGGNVELIKTWLNGIGLGQYYEKFLSNGFDDLAFIQKHGLTQDCCDLMEILPAGHRRKLMTAYKADEYLPIKKTAYCSYCY